MKRRSPNTAQMYCKVETCAETALEFIPFLGERTDFLQVLGGEEVPGLLGARGGEEEEIAKHGAYVLQEYFSCTHKDEEASCSSSVLVLVLGKQKCGWLAQTRRKCTTKVCVCQTSGESSDNLMPQVIGEEEVPSLLRAHCGYE
jgi:hypothetical protein